MRRPRERVGAEVVEGDGAERSHWGSRSESTGIHVDLRLFLT